MTEKQKRFADEYIIDCNATRAYKVAYPNIKSDAVAAQAASRLLRNVKVKKYIGEQLEKLRSEKVADAQEVMEYLTAVIRGESKSSVLAREENGSESVIEKPPDEKEKLKAAELLGKRYGLYTEKIETDIDTTISISIDYGDEEDES
jgi:phage terminase small subunit